MCQWDLLKKSLSLIALCACVAYPLAARATAATEVATAAEHAGLSATAADLEMAHAHLHHALNCLVGPNGEGYDSKAFDPCKGQGNGAIPDASDKPQKTALETVAGAVRKALEKSDLDTVKKDAAHAEAKLKAMKIK